MDTLTAHLTKGGHAMREVLELDLAERGLREVNGILHRTDLDADAVRILNPAGKHSVAVGLNRAIRVTIEGHTGYYAAGMNQLADVVINGNAGVGVAQNMMSGSVLVRGNASQSAGATAHGGLLVVEGDAAARCGISMKGVDIVVGGNVGHMSAFMAQAGRLVVRGDAGEALGDSLYEARIYVRGTVASLGADCVVKEMRPEHHEELAGLLKSTGFEGEDTSAYTRYGSARRLYNFHVDNTDAY
ncbi:protein glxC [Streptomyces hygroscopicus]|uniref:GltB/FmdC/FwdC-like GXGXG domain-containing protein n=1 Tax=Streptomyces hygroscopicus TaxID=1912 RepID=UPI00099DA4C6|nr:protein glxC [Streptomyces hygroscopicus]